MEWVGILIFLLIIFLIYSFWHIILPIAIVATIVGLVLRSYYSEKAAQRAEEQQKIQKTAHIAQRKAHLALLLSDAKKELHSYIPPLVAEASRHLDLAQQEFNEGAIAPFWDQILYAAEKLAEYRQRVQIINNKAIEYQSESPSLPAPVPPFDVPLDQIADARPTVERLAFIVKKAHKVPAFSTGSLHHAMVYEQRKTNKILMEGFSTLASAIDNLGNTIDFSLHELESNLHADLEHIHASVDSMSSAFAEDAEMRRKAEKRAAKSQEKRTDILDDIRSWTKPRR